MGQVHWLSTNAACWLFPSTSLVQPKYTAQHLWGNLGKTGAAAQLMEQYPRGAEGNPAGHSAASLLKEAGYGLLWDTACQQMDQDRIPAG